MQETEAARVAHTEALFREVNEQIADTAERFESTESMFVCECADSNCAHRVAATLAEYERVRSEPTQFLLAPGHEDERFERVVKKRGRHNVVEKVNACVVDVVRRLDPRAEPA